MKPKLQIGQDNHIKGYILNKLYLGRYFCKLGRKHHGKHTSVRNLPKGYPPEHRGKFPNIIKRLRRNGLISVFSSEGEKHACVVLRSDITEVGIDLCNEYRESAGLPLLDERFKEVVRRR